MRCKPPEHRTYLDHSFHRVTDNRLVWKCTKCGKQGLWVKGWLYFGNVECGGCGLAVIDRVYCSACAGDRKPIDDHKSAFDD